MFGIYRYVLSMMVIAAHLYPCGQKCLGGYAVFGFYLLSGYLMTMVLHRTYGFTLRGQISFFVNRFLRIYPPYYFVLILSVPLLYLYPASMKLFNFKLVLPNSLYDWILNFTILGITPGSTRMIPPAWSIAIELCFYILMAVYLAKDRYRTIVWFFSGLAYILYVFHAGFNFHMRYFDIAGCSLPFSVGSLIFHYKKHLNISAPTFLLALVLFIINSLYPYLFWKDILVGGFYFSLFLNACMLMYLMDFSPKYISGIDRLLGNISYPMFLCHFFIAALIVQFVFNGTKPEGVMLYFTAVAFTHLFAYLIYTVVDKRVNVFRDVIRTKL